MSSIVNRPKGHKWIQFVDQYKKRQTIRLGKSSKRDAESIAFRVDQLANATLRSLNVDRETALWLSGLGDQLYDKLARAGLCESRVSSELGTFIASYIDGRVDLKPGTLAKYRTVEKRLKEYFGDERRLDQITSGDAEDYRRWLGAKIGENTIRKDIQVAKTLFRYACSKELIRSNPFEGQATSSLPNPSRFYYVTREQAGLVLEQCPTIEWRLLFALARFGGLRTPSEPRELKWSDIDWDRKRIRVTSPKTEYYGKGHRAIPLFPELEPLLSEMFEQAADGAVYVLPKLQKKGYNPATHMSRIIVRACGECWPKTFQNCRSTRQTELAQEFPSHVITKWIGNSAKIAEQFYLQVTPEHFEKALKPTVQPEAESEAVDAISESKAKQNPKQHSCAPKSRNNGNAEGKDRNSFTVSSVLLQEVAVKGLEPSLPLGT